MNRLLKNSLLALAISSLTSVTVLAKTSPHIVGIQVDFSAIDAENKKTQSSI